MFGFRPDEDHVMRFDDLGETLVFRQEAIARVDRVGAGNFGGRDDRGEADVHRVGIGGRMDRDGLDAQFVACAMDAQRDLAAVGDQELFDGHFWISRW